MAMSTPTLHDSIRNYANRDWRALTEVAEQIDGCANPEQRLLASAALASGIRAMRRYDSTHQAPDLAALLRFVAAVDAVNRRA
jgi:hypothetical protein